MNIDPQIRTKLAGSVGLGGPVFRGFHSKNINSGTCYSAGAQRGLVDPCQHPRMAQALSHPPVPRTVERIQEEQQEYSRQGKV